MNRSTPRLITALLALTFAVTAIAKPSVPLFRGTGSHQLAVSTSSADAQRYFNQGLAFLYAFNHDESIRSFQAATELDPDCAMAWWGIAAAAGPHINFPLVPEPRAALAWEAIQKAQQLAARATPLEQALIAAQAKRYAPPPVADRAPLDQAYADAMREVWTKFPHDADVGALFAEAMMNLRPWDQWTPEGDAQPGTQEVVATLEHVMKLNPQHPQALHLYIHAVEASLDPARAIEPANRLRDLMPGVGHMVHMPSHIDVRTGFWEKAVFSNDKAIKADIAYRAQGGVPQGFIWIYNAHNRHMLAFAAMMTGRSELALQHTRAMVAEWPHEFISEYGAVIDFFYASPLEVMVRFGRWDEILAAAEPPETLPISRALRLAARGIAYAARGETDAARAEQQKFLAAMKLVPPDAAYSNNLGVDVVAVAEAMLEGEILYREGRTELGLAQLREAVRREDKLRYDEPPSWIIPVRHALGASLLQVGRVQEAEDVYRADLQRWPNNGWSLYGLAQALKFQDRHAEAAAIEKKFKEVWKHADTEITSSCLCLPGA